MTGKKLQEHSPRKTRGAAVHSVHRGPPVGWRCQHDVAMCCVFLQEGGVRALKIMYAACSCLHPERGKWNQPSVWEIFSGLWICLPACVHMLQHIKAGHIWKCVFICKHEQIPPSARRQWEDMWHGPCVCCRGMCWDDLSCSLIWARFFFSSREEILVCFCSTSLYPSPTWSQVEDCTPPPTPRKLWSQTS